MSIFINNKYTNWYFSIISNARTRTIPTNTYVERHHIVPKSLGGSNDKNNLVVLSAREHFICHWLLTKMVDGKMKYQMWNAFSCMLYRENDHQSRYKISSKIFENIKKEGAKVKSLKFSGPNNPMYGKTHSAESVEKIRKTHLGKEVLDETREKLRVSNKHTGPNYKLRGENNAMLKEGVREKREEIFLKKYGVTGPGLVEWTCEHCGKEGKGLLNYKRWHKDNCKFNPAINTINREK